MPIPSLTTSAVPTADQALGLLMGAAKIPALKNSVEEEEDREMV